MTQFLVRRLAHIGISLLLLTLVTFALLRLAPGGPAHALLGPDQISPEQQVLVDSRLGLDQPWIVQLKTWALSALRGDFGSSYFYRQPALDVVFNRLPNTLVLGALAFAIGVVVGVPAGIAAASRPNGWLDRISRSSAVVFVSLPSFWLGILLIFMFSARLGWMPSSGTGRTTDGFGLPSLANTILPAITLGLPTAATFMLHTRSSMTEAMATDAIRTARAQGLSESRIRRVHAFPQALAPVLMQIGLFLPHLIEGSIVVETVFSWPGIGLLTTASVGRRDYPILMAITMLLGIGTILASTITDILHARFDPRIELR